MIVGLELIKVFLAFIPGEPIEIVARNVLWKILGNNYYNDFCCCCYDNNLYVSKNIWKKIEKFENMKFLKNEKRLEMVLLILFVSPFVPKDVLIYLAGLLPINPVNFLLISILGRFPSIFSSTFAGENLAKGNIKELVWIYVITYLVIFIFIILGKLLVGNHKNDEKKLDKTS